jgi:hypothetical protein
MAKGAGNGVSRPGGWLPSALMMKNPLLVIMEAAFLAPGIYLPEYLIINLPDFIVCESCRVFRLLPMIFLSES